MENKRAYFTDNLIVKLSFELALDIIQYSELLFDLKKFVIAKQILRCGTSIGANIREAQNAESKPDFIHKFKIAAKEADELEYWLELCKYSKDYHSTDNLIKKLVSISKIINKIVSTSKQKPLINHQSIS